MRIDRTQLPTGPLFIQCTLDDDAIDVEERSVRFVASDESVDRYGDIVQSDWNLKPFKKNPVFLWNHDRALPPIGTINPVGVENNRLLVTANFTEAGVNPLADQLYKLTQKKVLRAVSVGFTVAAEDVELLRNEKGDWTGGYKYNNPELLEISLCSVPANANALAVARSLNITEANIHRALLPDALVETAHRKAYMELVGARVRLARITSPR